MPYLLRRIIVISIFGCLSAQATSGDIKQPDVQALIGIKIPDDPNYIGPGWRAGSIADISDNWACLDGTRSGKLAVDICYRHDGLTALIVTHRSVTYRDYSTIVDAHILHSNTVRFPNDVRKKFGWGKKEQAHHRQRKNAYLHCFMDKKQETAPAIFGVASSEAGISDDCPHFTRRIEQVWQLDSNTQRMVPLSPVGVFCWWNACLLEGICSNEDQCNMP